MAMLTPTLAEAARQMAAAVLIDSVDVYSVGSPVTVGFEVTRPLTKLVNGIPALVQTTTLENAVESRTNSVYSVKVARGTVLDAGMVIEVVSCLQEPSLVGKKLLLDKVSKNGLAMLRKAVASDFEAVNQEGKRGI